MRLTILHESGAELVPEGTVIEAIDPRFRLTVYSTVVISSNVPFLGWAEADGNTIIVGAAFQETLLAKQWYPAGEFPVTPFVLLCDLGYGGRVLPKLDEIGVVPEDRCRTRGQLEEQIQKWARKKIVTGHPLWYRVTKVT